VLINSIIDNMPENENYRKLFLEELNKYSLEGRKKGEKPSSGCVYELDNINEINPLNPDDVSKLVKEGIHLMYQKGTAKLVLKALIENLK
jgi:hypothetical protein